MTDPLTTAVHRLTRETRSKVIQDGDSAPTVAIVVHAPLLQQLSEAVTSATGKGGGGGNSANDVLNGDALYKVAIIRAAILDWVHAAGLVTVRDMSKDLEAWAASFSSSQYDPAWFIRRIEGWATLIEGLLDPPNRLEVTEACPNCGKDEFTDATGRVLKFPVIIEFRRDRPGEARGLCRSCDEVWAGEREIRRLRWDIGVQEVG